MVIMYGRLEYDIHHEQPHDVATSQGPEDVAVLEAPEDAAGCFLTPEDQAVRVSLDGEDPSPSHGLLVVHGTHFFPLSRDLRFVSAGQGPATVSVLWVRTKLAGAPSTD
jgi:hypothetical protein